MFIDPSHFWTYYIFYCKFIVNYKYGNVFFDAAWTRYKIKKRLICFLVVVIQLLHFVSMVNKHLFQRPLENTTHFKLDIFFIYMYNFLSQMIQFQHFLSLSSLILINTVSTLHIFNVNIYKQFTYFFIKDCVHCFHNIHCMACG